MEIFISGLPRSIEGNVTASKPQTLEEAINIAQRLMDQIIKCDSVQETNDHKRKFEDKRNIIDNNNYPKYHNNNNHSNNRNNDNYQNNHNNHNHNNDYHHQQNRRQEAFRTYTATNGYTGNRPFWDVHLQLAEFPYNNSYHSSIRCALFEALYGKKCRSPVLWAEIRESRLIGPELVQETTDKVVLIMEKLKARGPEFTWERKDHMKAKYPRLFADCAVEPTS
ncbi:reverse transcriptase domain-containing protein [Tanacetum coccineum]